MKKAVYLSDATASLSCDYGKDIKIDLIPFQQLNPLHDSIKGSLPIDPDAVVVVEFPVSIQRDAHQEMILPQELRPTFIQKDPVGLQRILHRQAPGVVFFHQLYRATEKIQTGQSGFASLEGQRHPAVRPGKRLFQHKG